MNHRECAHVGWSSPFPINSADASRYKCQKELLALADHVKCDPCRRCMDKHLTFAIMLAYEAGGLNGGTPEDLGRGDQLERLRGEVFGRDPHGTLREISELCATLARLIGHL